MKASFWISLAVISCGLVILFLPDNGQRVFSFNEDHGPSWLDLVGVLLIISGWIFWVMMLFQQRARIYYHCKKRGMLLLALLLVAGIALIIVGLQNENDALLYSGIVLSVATYSYPLWIAFKRLN